MKSRRRKSPSSPFTDRALLDLLLAKAEPKLTAAELAEVTALAFGLESGAVDGLARTTRDRLMAIAQRCGVLIRENPQQSYGAWKDSKEANREPTEGDLVAEVVLVNLPKTPPGRTA